MLGIEAGKNAGIYQYLLEWANDLALAQAVGMIIEADMYVSGVRHLYSNDRGKVDLVSMICGAFGSTATITPVEWSARRDTPLRTRYPEFLTRLNVPPIGEQITTLAKNQRSLWSLARLSTFRSR